MDYSSYSSLDYFNKIIRVKTTSKMDFRMLIHDKLDKIKYIKNPGKRAIAEFYYQGLVEQYEKGRGINSGLYSNLNKLINEN